LRTVLVPIRGTPSACPRRGVLRAGRLAEAELRRHECAIAESECRQVSTTSAPSGASIRHG